MFPLRDENPTSRVTWMTWVLIGLNLLVFAYEVWLEYAMPTGSLNAFIEANAFNSARFFAQPGDPRQLFTIFSAMFMHAGWLHIGGNMLYLWIFGNNVEDRLGPLRFLGFYLVCGVAATVAQAAVSPSSSVPSLGASGAVAGVLAAYLLLFPRARVITAVFIVLFIELVALPAWLVILIWFVIQLGQGLGSLGHVTTSSGGVAYFAHVGGFTVGLLLALPLWFTDRRRQNRFVGWN